MGLETQTIMTAYTLAGDFEEKCKEVSSMKDIMWLACDLAHAAILAERERCGAIAQGIIDESQEDDEFARGWQAAGDAMRVEIFEIQPWSSQDG